MSALLQALLGALTLGNVNAARDVQACEWAVALGHVDAATCASPQDTWERLADLGFSIAEDEMEK